MLCWEDFKRLPFEAQKEFLTSYRKAGFSDVQIRDMLGVPRSTWVRWLHEHSLQRSGSVERKPKEPDTLCWQCSKALGKCSWSHNLTPVKGWTAVQTPPAAYETGALSKRPGYRVIDCPQFIYG